MRVDLVDAVLDRRAREHEGVAAAQAFDGLRGLGAPVLDALGLIEHDDVGLQPPLTSSASASICS